MQKRIRNQKNGSSKKLTLTVLDKKVKTRRSDALPSNEVADRITQLRFLLFFVGLAQTVNHSDEEKVKIYACADMVWSAALD